MYTKLTKMLLWRVKKIFNLTKGGFIFKMKLVKYLVTTAAITAVMAVSASAATLETSGEFKVTVDEATKKVSLSDIGLINGDQMTMLILNNDATTVTEGDIEQIDQGATATSWADIAMKDIELGKEYIVKIGGDGVIKKATFKLVEDTPTTPKWHVGNIDLSGTAYQEDLMTAIDYITTGDVIMLLRYASGEVDNMSDEQLEWADIVGDINGDIATNDFPTTTDVIGLLQLTNFERTNFNAYAYDYYLGE